VDFVGRTANLRSTFITAFVFSSVLLIREKPFLGSSRSDGKQQPLF
jgi:hypothetical protein